MGLQDRLSRPDGNGTSALADPGASAPAASGERARRSKGTVDPYAELKTRIHHGVIATVGVELFKQEMTEDLHERVMRSVTEQLVARPDAADTGGAPADRPRDHRRHPRLRAARAAPARRLRHRDHGQRVQPDLLSSAPAGSSARPRPFVDESHLLRIINKIVAQVGRRVDEASPMVDARLPDGSPRERDHPAALAERAARSRSGSSRATRSTSRTWSARLRSPPKTAQFLERCVQGAAQHPHLGRYRLR